MECSAYSHYPEMTWGILSLCLKENPTPWSHLYGFFVFESYLKYKNICRGKVLGARFSCSSRKNLHNHSTSRLRVSISWFYLWRAVTAGMGNGKPKGGALHMAHTWGESQACLSLALCLHPAKPQCCRSSQVKRGKQ